jgi:hypothetical protein
MTRRVAFQLGAHPVSGVPAGMMLAFQNIRIRYADIGVRPRFAKSFANGAPGRQ